MQPKVLMSVDEYLHTPFDGADCDYVDGEVIERNMGELPHALLQGELLYRLRQVASSLNLLVIPEIRIQVSQTRLRVADVAVWRPGPIGTRIPTVPPLLVVEVLSAEDRLVRLQPKIRDYLTYGVEWLWIIDPDERRALTYAPSDPGGTLVTELRTTNPDIVVSLPDLLAVLDREP